MSFSLKTTELKFIRVYLSITDFNRSEYLQPLGNSELYLSIMAFNSAEYLSWSSKVLGDLSEYYGLQQCRIPVLVFKSSGIPI